MEIRRVGTLGFAFLALTVLVVSGVLKPLDEAVSRAAAFLVTPFSDSLFFALRSIGDTNNLVIIIAAITIYALFKKYTKFALFSFIFFILAIWAGNELKGFLRLPRPEIVATTAEITIAPVMTSFAYPSGHALGTTFVFCTLAALAARLKMSPAAHSLIRGLSYSMIVGVAFASVYVRAHWPSDVLGGCILGYLFYRVMLIAARKENI